MNLLQEIEKEQLDKLLAERAVPPVLLSGDHARIRAWRREAAERLTRERRPDLWRRRGREEEVEG